MRILTSRAMATAAAAAIALSTLGFQPASAHEWRHPQARYNNGDAAAAVAALAIAGTVAAIIAASQHRNSHGPVYRASAHGPHGGNFGHHGRW